MILKLIGTGRSAFVFRIIQINLLKYSFLIIFTLQKKKLKYMKHYKKILFPLYL